MKYKTGAAAKTNNHNHNHPEPNGTRDVACPIHDIKSRAMEKSVHLIIWSSDLAIEPRTSVDGAWLLMVHIASWVLVWQACESLSC